MADSTNEARTRRRWFGAVCLAGAIGMLVAEELALKERLAPVGALLYWVACFFLASVAVGVALVDLRALRQRSREEQRDLFEKTLQEIDREKQGRHPGDREKSP